LYHLLVIRKAPPWLHKSLLGKDLANKQSVLDNYL
jgi:hypothetical protein